MPAKHTAPSVDGVLLRERLFEQLDNSLQGQLTWITAPAGAGKTTLVASYLQQRQIDYLWYGVSEDDNDPAAIFQNIRQLLAQRGIDSESIPPYHPELQADLMAYTRRFFEGLLPLLPAKIVWVLEDYHQATADSPTHQMLQQAIQELSADNHLLVLSRHFPPPLLAPELSRAGGRLIQGQQLEFSPAEFEQLLKLVGVDMDAETRQQLLEVSGGWAAALRLLIADFQTAGHFTHAPDSREHSLLFDYFSGLIFQALDPDQQQALAILALAPFINRGLAEQLADMDAAWAFLERLHQENYFVYLRPDADDCYEFHHLFRAFLLRQAEQRFDAAELTQHYARVADSLIGQGYISEAAVIYSRCDELDKLAGLIKTYGLRYYESGQGKTVIEWFKPLPRDSIQADPWLALIYGMLHSAFAPDVAYPVLQQAVDDFLASEDDQGLALSWYSYAITCAMIWTHFDAMNARLPKVLARLSGYLAPDSLDQDLKLKLLESLAAIASSQDPELLGLENYLTEAERLVLQLDDPNQAPMLYYSLAYSTIIFGDNPNKFRRLISHLQAQDQEGRLQPFLQYVMTTLMVNTSFLDCDPDAGYQALARVKKLQAEFGFTLFDRNIDGFETRLALYAKCPDQAAAALDIFSRKYSDPIPTIRGHQLHLKAWHALQTGCYTEALEAASVAVEILKPSQFTIGQILTSQARTMAAVYLGDWSQADDSLAYLNNNKTAAAYLRYGTLLMHAFYMLRRQRRNEARRLLDEALTIADQHQLVAPLDPEYRMLSELFSFALAENIHQQYVLGIIRRLSLAPPGPTEHWPWAMRCRVAGEFQVELDGAPLPLKKRAPAKTLVLLKAILAGGGKDVSLDWLSECLWPDADGDYARRSLDTTLHRLRKQVGSDMVVTVGGHIGLNPESCWLDLWSLQACIDEIWELEVDAADSFAELCRLVARVSTLYPQPLLAGDDSPWLVPLRDRWQQRVSQALVRAGDALLKLEHPAQAVRAYHFCLEIAPDDALALQGVERCYG